MVCGKAATLNQLGQSPPSGIILAGGRSRRLGRDKAVESVGGQPLIQRVIHRLSQVTSEIVVVVADQTQADQFALDQGQRVTQDLYLGKGSLGGIFSGLTAARQEWSLVVACDMPFLNLELLRYLMSRREGFVAVVPVLEGRPEPTHALYSKACLLPMEQRLMADDLKISGFYDQVRVDYVDEEEIVCLDPDCLSFFNVNSPPDLEKALALVAQGR